MINQRLRFGADHRSCGRDGCGFITAGGAPGQATRNTCSENEQWNEGIDYEFIHLMN